VNIQPTFPSVGDRLFIQADVRDSAVAGLTTDPAERFYRLPLGYKRAGDVLTDKAAQDHIDRMNIIYSALHCYRHAIELFLKQSIDVCGESSHGHVLDDLWKQYYALVMKGMSVEPDGLAATGALIAEMAAADQRSDGFRYPTDTAGRTFSFAGPIDLANLKIVMQRLETFFECGYLDLCQRYGAT